MNARTNQLQLTAECRQLKEVVCVAFHTILVHRVFGKFKYSTNIDYSLGSLGHEEISCNYIDLSYIRVNSPELVSEFDGKISIFVDAVDRTVSDGYFLTGSASISAACAAPSQREGRIYGIDRWETLFPVQIKLEFYQRRKRQWLIPEDTAPWEVWELQLNLVRTLSNEDFFRMREFTAEKLSDIVFHICELINKPQYLPKIPSQPEISSVYDVRFSDCCPYLWRLDSEYGLRSTENVTRGASFVRKLFRDTLAFTTG
ncbi:hypothetical protein niasHS_003536 [Heterodera schachtii]|uniref:Autophagy-related protein 101 n=2 Tax=Heterodera TaxID=34509 RepID=A0ABD2KGS6_HETSC